MLSLKLQDIPATMLSHGQLYFTTYYTHLSTYLKSVSQMLKAEVLADKTTQHTICSTQETWSNKSKLCH